MLEGVSVGTTKVAAILVGVSIAIAVFYYSALTMLGISAFLYDKTGGLTPDKIFGGATDTLTDAGKQIADAIRNAYDAFQNFLDTIRNTLNTIWNTLTGGGGNG